MRNTNDIFTVMKTILDENGFKNESLEVKKQMIDENLKLYLTEKVGIFNPIEKIKIQAADLTVVEIHDILHREATLPEKNNVTTPVISYLIKEISNLQGSEINIVTHESIYSDKKTQSNIRVTLNSDGTISKVSIKNDANYKKVFNFLYSIFQTNHLVKDTNFKSKTI